MCKAEKAIPCSGSAICSRFSPETVQCVQRLKVLGELKYCLDDLAH